MATRWSVPGATARGAICASGAGPYERRQLSPDNAILNRPILALTQGEGIAQKMKFLLIMGQATLHKLRAHEEIDHYADNLTRRGSLGVIRRHLCLETQYRHLLKTIVGINSVYPRRDTSGGV